MSKKILLISLIVTLISAFALPAAAQQGPGGRSPADRPVLGVAFEDVDGQAVVSQILPGSPAEAAGIETGDIITSVNEDSVDASTLADTIRQYAAGDTITLGITRGEESLTLEVTLESPRMNGPRFNIQPMRINPRGFLGVQLERGETGVVIAEVVEGSPAAEAGLLAGDIITAINGSEIGSPDEAAQIIFDLIPGDIINLEILRDGESQNLDLTLGERFIEGPRIFNNYDILSYSEEDSVWIVEQLDEASPLREAGLLEGDRITAINGEQIEPGSVPGLGRGGGFDLGETITLSVERDGESLEIEVPTAAIIMMLFNGEIPGIGGRLPGMPYEFQIPEDGFRHGDPRGFNFEFGPMRGVLLGVGYENLDEELATENELSVTEGALVTQVLEGSPAEAAGILVGDVITMVDGDVVDAERTLGDRIRAYEAEDVITLTVIREGESLEIEVTLESMQPMFREGIPAVPDSPAIDATEEISA